MQTQLVMRRENLCGLPAVTLPAGFSVRCFAPGDQAAWNRMVVDVWAIDFDEKIMADAYFAPERVQFICHDDVPVATATAWYQADDPCVGVVHMVASNPAYRGRGLGLQVTAAALHQMRADGKVAATLTTDDFRLAAIKTYLKLGFAPLASGEGHAERWDAVLGQLGWPR